MKLLAEKKIISNVYQKNGLDLIKLDLYFVTKILLHVAAPFTFT